MAVFKLESEGWHLIRMTDNEEFAFCVDGLGWCLACFKTLLELRKQCSVCTLRLVWLNGGCDVLVAVLSSQES